MDANRSNYSGWERIIKLVKSPLSLLVLFVLVSYSLLIPIVVNADGLDRTITIAGMILVLIMVLIVVYFKIDVLWPNPDALPENLTFERVLNDVEPALDRLEENDYELAHIYGSRGDSQRLIDGLFSSLLYCSHAIIRGHISPLFYGNLMDWDESSQALRVRYSSGPYHDEIVVREFPLEGDKQGVASAALNKGALQIINDTVNILMLPKEARLKAMISIPLQSKEVIDNGYNGQIMVLNIDSTMKNSFPSYGTPEYDIIESRIRHIKNCLNRVNRMKNILQPLKKELAQ